MRTLTPATLLVFFLIALAASAAASASATSMLPWISAIEHGFVLSVSAIITFSIISRLSPIARSTTENRVITTVILFLLFDPSYPWWAFAILGSLAEIVERLLRAQSGPLFNPAGIALLSLAILGFPPTWWGVSFSPRFEILGTSASIAAFFTFAIAGYIAWKYRKLIIVGSSIVAFSLFSLLLFRVFPLFSLVEGTLLFFFLVMATEPKTSPSRAHDQKIFGGIIGASIAFGSFFHVPDAALCALSLGNLFHHREWIKKQFALLFRRKCPMGMSSQRQTNE